MTEAIRLLEELLAQLPTEHQERPGVIRSIEVLRDEAAHGQAVTA